MNNRLRSATSLVGASLTLLAAGSLAACSSSEKEVGATTTVIASTTAVSTTIALTTVPATEPPTTPAPTTAPPATEPPTTPAPVSGWSLYDVVDPPVLPSGRTDPFVTSGVLADGVYWVEYNGGETLTPSVTVLQAFFGDECVAKAAELGDECLNDYLVVADPSSDIDDLPFADDVFLSVSDVMTQQSLRITPEELRQIRASSPSDGAPDGFGFVPFAWMMTVQGGEITWFEQIWTP